MHSKLKKIKELHTVAAVNEHLDAGWFLIELFNNRSFIVGYKGTSGRSAGSPHNSGQPKT